MADQTILSKWQALFPNNSPESNINAVNGQAVDGSGGLVNAVKSPFREASEQATDNWSSNNSFPVKGDSDIIAMYDSASVVTGLPVDETPAFADGRTEGHPLRKRVQDSVYTSKEQNPGGSLNTTRLLTKNDIDSFEKFTTNPLREDDSDPIAAVETEYNGYRA